MKKLMLLLIFGMTAGQAVFANSNDLTEIHRAATAGDLNKVNSILATTPDIDVRDSAGATPLHWSIWQNNIEVVRVLIDYGYDINAQAIPNGYTPMHDAVWANNLKAARLLLTNGADLSIKGKDNFTPVEKARNENKGAFTDLFENTSYSEK